MTVLLTLYVIFTCVSLNSLVMKLVIFPTYANFVQRPLLLLVFILVPGLLICVIVDVLYPLFVIICSTIFRSVFFVLPCSTPFLCYF